MLKKNEKTWRKLKCILLSERTLSEKEYITPEEIDFGVKKGIVSCSTIAVFGGSAVKNYGIVNLLDNIISTLPSPKDATHPKAIIDGKECEVAPDENGQTIIRVFKTIVDPFVGRVNYVKVISGKGSGCKSLANDYRKQGSIAAPLPYPGPKSETFPLGFATRKRNSPRSSLQ